MSAPVPFVSWEMVKLRVAEALQTDQANLGTQWNGLCSAAARDATAELRRIFVMKGYPPECLASWDDRAYYAERLASWFAIVRGITLASYDTKALEWLDPRKELSEASALIIDGVAKAPGDGNVGGVKAGTLTAGTNTLRRKSDGSIGSDWGEGTDWRW